MINIKGLKEAKAAFAKLPAAARDRLGDATRVTASEIVRNAKSRAPVRYGFLRDAIKMTFNKRTGAARVGIERRRIAIAGQGGSALRSKGAKLIDPSKYAKFAEFGTPRHPAQPFMLPAAEAEKQAFLDRCRAAGKDLEHDLASGGGVR